jgi:membrane-associated phospholipid phosphatase
MLFDDFRVLSKEDTVFFIGVSVALALMVSKFDLAVISYFAKVQNEHMSTLWTVITFFGHGAMYFLLATLGVMVSFCHRLGSAEQRFMIFKFSVVSLASLIGSGVFVRLLKWGIGRSRPCLWLESGFQAFSPFSFLSEYNAFPSGHAQTAFTIAFLLSLLIPRGRAVFFIAASFVALSRVVLLKHWPSDVLIGSAIGMLLPAWITFLCCHFFKKLAQ